MLRKILMSAAAATALASAPAMAQHGPGGSHGGGPLGSMGGGAGAAAGGAIGGGPAGAALDARMNSMGPANASATGDAHANANSVLRTNATTTSRIDERAMTNSAFPGTKATKRVTSGSLAGLTTGTILLSNGTNVGTVEQIRTAGNGMVTGVIVRGTNGSLFALPANKLSLQSGMLSTTARLNGVNARNVAGMNLAVGVSQGPMHASATGMTHANAHSVLSGGTVSGGVLTGLATGAAVRFNGNTVGTVSRIVTSAGGTVERVLVKTTNGRIVSLSPKDLSFSGGTLTTTTFRGG